MLAHFGVLLLAGCGFHLQGTLAMPAEMQRTYIDAVERNSQFHLELRKQLRMAGVEVVDAPDDTTAILSISIDKTAQRVLSVSARNVPTEYEVFYTIEYAVSLGETSLLTPQLITRTHDYTYDETLVLGKAREEQLLRDAIVQDLVRIVLRQLATL